MKDKDLRIGLLLMAIFAVLYAVSFTFPKSVMSSTHTGAAFFPRVVLILGMGLTLILIIKSILQKKTYSRSKVLKKDEKQRVLGSMGLAALFGFSAVYVGTFVSLFFLIIAIMVLWGVRNKVTILLNALLTPVFVYLVFTRILMVQFPSGLLF